MRLGLMFLVGVLNVSSIGLSMSLDSKVRIPDTEILSNRLYHCCPTYLIEHEVFLSKFAGREMTLGELGEAFKQCCLECHVRRRNPDTYDAIEARIVLDLKPGRLPGLLKYKLQSLAVLEREGYYKPCSAISVSYPSYLAIFNLETSKK